MRWHGTAEAFGVALTELAGPVGTLLVVPAPATLGAPGSVELAEVEPDALVRWALAYPDEAEVTGPLWLCEWIADEAMRHFDEDADRRDGGKP